MHSQILYLKQFLFPSRSLVDKKYLYCLKTGMYDSLIGCMSKAFIFVMDIIATTPFKDEITPLCFDSSHDIEVSIIPSSSPYNSLHASCIVLSAAAFGTLTLSWRRFLSYRNQSIDLQSKSMHRFLFDTNLHHGRIN